MEAVFNNSDVKKLNKYFSTSSLDIGETDSREDMEKMICGLMERYGHLTAGGYAEAEKKLEYANGGKAELLVRDEFFSGFSVGDDYYILRISFCFFDSGSEDYCYVVSVR